MANRNTAETANRNTVETANTNRDLEERVNQLEERVRALVTQCNETLPALIETKAKEARDDAVAKATRLAQEARAEAIAEATKLAEQARTDAVTEATKLAEQARTDAVTEAARLAQEARAEAIAEATRLAQEARDAAIAEATRLAQELAKQARDAAIAEAARLAQEARDAAIAEATRLAQEARDAAIAEAGRLVAALSQKHDDLATIVAKLKIDVDYLKDPLAAAREIADARLPLYRDASVDELKVMVAEDDDRPQVLIEIAKRLAPGDNTDSKVLTNMFTFVEDQELMAELVTFSGTGDITLARALGGSRNGR